MRVLILRGNPRKGGVSDKMADLFAEGLRRTPAHVDDVDLCSSNINPCRGCFICSSSDSARGACPINDDMRAIIPLVEEADALVCVSPVYFYGMSAQMKAFFDRCFPFVKGYDFDKEKGNLINITSFPLKPKKLVTISVASGRLRGSFDAMSATYASIAGALGIEYVADIRRGESPYFSILGGMSLRVRRVLDAMVKAGEQFGLEGFIQPRTLRTAELELAESDAAFAANAKVFWALRKRGDSRGGFSSGAASEDMGILLSEMCKRFSPQNSPKNASIRFDFGDSRVYSIKIAEGSCELCRSSDFKEQLAVYCAPEVWVGLSSGRKNAIEEMKKGFLKVEGDLSLMAKLNRIFPRGNA